MKHTFVIFTLLISYCSLQAQPSKRANIWYFGSGMGIDFNQNPPKEVYGHTQKDPTESFSVMCDTGGKMLLYTDGTTVWNAANKVVKNGGSIDIQTTSAQGALFLPWPKNDSLVFLFQALGFNLNYGYSLINLNGNNGTGEVIQKNKTLIYTGPSDGEEKQIAINHANGRDVWVITHKVNTNEYYAYLVTDKGLVTCPVVSKTGSVTCSDGAEQGYMSITSDGSLLSNPFLFPSVNNHNGMVDISRFNNQTGEISNTLIIDGFYSGPFGSCFSPNGKKLYLNELVGLIYQMDLEYLQKDSIKKRTDTLLKVRRTGNEAMYLAPDNKIYINNNEINNEYRIGIIAQPDKKGIQCGYGDTCTINFGKGSNPSLGLPNFNRSYLYNPEIELYYEFDKTAGTLKLQPYDTFDTGINRWISVVNLNKQDSVVFNGKKDTTIALKDTGYYLLRYFTGNGKSKTKILDNRIFIPKNFLGHDTIFCPLKHIDYVLQAPKGMHCYQWSNSKKSDSIHVTKPGKYAVLVTLPSMLQVWDTVVIDTFKKLNGLIATQKHDTIHFIGGTAPYAIYRNGTLFKTTNNKFVKVPDNATYIINTIDSNNCYTLADTVLVKYVHNKNITAQNSVKLIIKNNKIQLLPIDCCVQVLVSDVTGRTLYSGSPNTIEQINMPQGQWLICRLLQKDNTIQIFKIYNP